MFTKMVLAQVQLYAGCRPDAILVSSAFAGAGFISRQMYKEFVAPYEDEVFRAIRNHGIKSYVHTCGAIGDRLDLMAGDVGGRDRYPRPAAAGHGGPGQGKSRLWPAILLQGQSRRRQ